ncbi:MAG: hypothetical protein WAZ12_02545 [Candidatus Absconditicoccaceae bacterium]
MNKPNLGKDEVNEVNYKEYLEKINQDLEKIKDTYADPLDGILKYDKKGICTTFFGEIEGNIDIGIIISKEKEIVDIVTKIDGIKSDLNNKLGIPPNLKEVYIKSLESMKNKFLMFKNALWIEGEKSGYILSDEERNIYYTNVLDLQKKVYGERVSDNPKEVKDTLDKLHILFEKNKGKLDEEEVNIFNNFLSRSDKDFSFSYIIKEKEQTEAKKDLVLEEKNIDKSKLKKISQDIVNFYKNHFGEENTDLGKWNIIEQSGISSLNISGMKEEFRIPEDYENVDRKKITQTVASHEIEQHLLGWDNNNRVLGKGFTSGGYDFISEGVAKINEDISLGKVNSIEDLIKLKEGVSIGIIGVFVCENYSYEDAVKILTIYNKLSSKDDEEKCKKKAIDIVKRRKRFVPYNMPGSSIKDTLYQRGKNRVIDYLTEDSNLETAIKKYKDLNTFKFGPEELKYINEIKKELDVKDEELIYTLFIGRILHDKLNKGKGSTKEYLSGMNLNKKNIEFKTKRELVNILGQLKESKKENQS